MSQARRDAHRRTGLCQGIGESVTTRRPQKTENPNRSAFGIPWRPNPSASTAARRGGDTAFVLTDHAFTQRFPLSNFRPRPPACVTPECRPNAELQATLAA